MNCRRCGIELTNENWRNCDRKREDNVCKFCYRKDDDNRRMKKGIPPKEVRKLTCRICDAPLTIENCYPTCLKNYIRLCKKCCNKENLKYGRTEKGIASKKLYYQKNIEQIRENTIEYKKIYNKMYYELNKEREKERVKKWVQTEEGKKCKRKKDAERQRELGYIELNSWFENLHGHHINSNDVIYIPKEWNRMVYHNVKSGKNMEIVNTYAYFFLVQQNIGELNKMFNNKEVI